MKIGEVVKAGTLQSMIDDLSKFPLEIFARRRLELFGLHRRHRLSHRQISGKPFEQFLKERIFDPLGMRRYDFYVPADKVHRFAACYSADPQGA